MNYPIIQKPDPNNPAGNITIVPQFLVIHATATPGASDEAESNYFNTPGLKVSVHMFIDWDSITQKVPLNKKCYHAGAKANSKSFGVEMCEPSTKLPFIEQQRLFNEVYKRTVWWAASQCVQRGWDISHVWSHYNVTKKLGGTDHTDPNAYLAKYGKSWLQMKQDIAAEIARQKTPAPKKEDKFVATKHQRFTDVPKSHWAFDAIETVAKAGIMIGNLNSTFQPDRPATRAQVAVIVARLLEKKV